MEKWYNRWLSQLTMLLPGRIYIALGPWHFRNYCNIILPNSSVSSGGRGELEPAIGPKSTQNSTFLVLLRPIFAAKTKTAPSSAFGSRSCEVLAVIWIRIVEFFGSGAHPKSVKTFFFPWRSPVFGRKTFFLRSPVFGWKNPLNFGKDLFFFFEIT